MVRYARLVVAMTFALAGCGPGTRQISLSVGNALGLNDGADACGAVGPSSIFAAHPICTRYAVGPASGAPPVPSPVTAAIADSDSDGAGSNAERLRFIGAALADSFAKCSGFVTSFTGTQSTENATFDVISIALSSLGAAFVPAGTVRALSAASAITLGTKNAINTDLFQQLTVQLFVQQLNQTYFADLLAYINALATSSPASASLAYVKIQLIHRECSIAFAAASISASQKGTAATSPTAVGAATLAAGSTFKAPDGTSYAMTAVSGGNVTYTVTHADGAAATPVTAPADAVAALLSMQGGVKQ